MQVWVDASTDAVRVSSVGAMPHVLQATLQVWRNASVPYAYAGSDGVCTSLHPNLTQHADTVVPGDESILFYHRVLPDWVSPDWGIDLRNQQMPHLPAPHPLVNNTFGGLLTGEKGAVVRTGPMQLRSSSPRPEQHFTIAGIAGVYDELSEFESALQEAASRPNDPHAHAREWSGFWENADINITAAPHPARADVAAAAGRVTLMGELGRCVCVLVRVYACVSVSVSVFVCLCVSACLCMCTAHFV